MKKLEEDAPNYPIIETGQKHPRWKMRNFGQRCLKCGYEWFSRYRNPWLCPGCKRLSVNGKKQQPTNLPPMPKPSKVALVAVNKKEKFGFIVKTKLFS